ncbi:MAG: pseudouridine synthase [Deltaproteobacteria bacterium RBG_16_71_12]|nr:MAG: pseudouridine synthase [Deltaproteobacteria bacterium RBG_16_71_12]
MTTTIALHKPWGMLSRFTSDGSGNRTLAELGLPKGVYPVGRLDADSEGLLILSDDKRLVDRLLAPERAHGKTYWVQVERVPDDVALSRLRAGVVIGGRRTLPAKVRRIDEPALAPRDPPVRSRRTVPTSWLELVIVEGKNRQVRKMTAAVGHPTLRLVRAAIGRLELGELPRGGWRVLDDDERRALEGR